MYRNVPTITESNRIIVTLSQLAYAEQVKAAPEQVEVSTGFF